MERRPIAAVTGARQGIGRGIAFASLKPAST
jgi:NAD(P)-dependent dehydrogenase (short-subunit alcohol dehydrogenase family)